MASTFFTDYSFASPNDNIIVSTSSVQEVPSNKKSLINLTVNGVLKPSIDIYSLILTFAGGQGPSKDHLSGSYGSLCIGKKVYSAEKFIRTAYDRNKRTLTIFIDVKRICTHLQKATRFSFDVQINDCGWYCPCSVGCSCLLSDKCFS